MRGELCEGRAGIVLSVWLVLLPLISSLDSQSFRAIFKSSDDAHPLETVQSAVHNKINDRLQITREERTDPAFELNDFKIKYYALQKQFDDLLDKCPGGNALHHHDILYSIRSNRIDIDELLAEVAALKREKRRSIWTAVEERVEDLRWIRTLVTSHEQHKEQKAQGDKKADASDAKDRWLKELDKVERDVALEKPALRSRLVQEVVVGTLLDWPELESVGFALLHNGNWLDALRLHEILYSRRNETLGPSHPGTLATQAHLILSLDRLHEYGKALHLLTQAFHTQLATHGINHEKTLQAEHNIARGLQSQGNFPEALRLFKHVYEKQFKALGPYHPHTLLTFANIEQVLKDLP